tara:strand:- start:2879 stop:3346 length:468 start_codon:yes stop_codon:yes gene_type:complete
MIDYFLALAAILVFLYFKNEDSFIVAGTFIILLSVFELHDSAGISYALSGVYCFAVMASVWLAASVYVNGKWLSFALMSTACFVGACGIMDAFMPIGSKSTAILFELYPYAMMSTQIIVLIMAGRHGIHPVYFSGGALSKLVDCGRNTFKASGVK